MKIGTNIQKLILATYAIGVVLYALVGRALIVDSGFQIWHVHKVDFAIQWKASVDLKSPETVHGISLSIHLNNLSLLHVN